MLLGRLLIAEPVRGHRPWPDQNVQTSSLLRARTRTLNRSSFVFGLLRAGADTYALDAQCRTALDMLRERTTRFSTASSNDCARYLTQARNSQAAASSQVAKYEGIAVIHPGEEISLITAMPSYLAT